MITTVNDLKVGDRFSLLGKRLRNDIMTIKDKVLTHTRDFEWINPWLPPEPTVLCYRLTLVTDGFPESPCVYRYTLDYEVYKHEDAPTNTKEAA